MVLKLTNKLKWLKLKLTAALTRRCEINNSELNYDARVRL